MTPFEYQECIKRVRDIWGNSPQWEHAELNYRRNRRIQTMTKQQFMSAVGSYEHEGLKWPPSLPQVVARAVGTHTGEAERPDPALCTHPTIGVLGVEEVCAVCLESWETGTRVDIR